MAEVPARDRPTHPADKQLHLIVDNYATHKHPKVQVAGPPSALSHVLHPDQQFMAQHGRALLPRPHREAAPPRHLPRVEELIMAIGDYIDKHNDNPKPFVWTAKASDILEKVKRARAALNNRQSA